MILGGLLAVPLLSAARAPQAAAPPTAPPRRLRLKHLHTRESIDLVYHDGIRYLPKALAQLDRFLRDHRDGTIKPIDPLVLDFLHDLTRTLGFTKPVHIVCGYRSPKSNALLRAKSSGVAKKSLHLQGRALDIRMPGSAPLKVADAARKLNRGGVGLYTRSNFVHIDSGRCRTWGA